MFEPISYKGKTYTFDNILRYRGMIIKLESKIGELNAKESNLVLLYNDTDTYYTNTIVNK